MRVDEDTFRQLVSEALDQLPPRFHRAMNNVQVVVEERPPADIGRRFRGLLLGLYQGVPLNRRSVHGLRLPDKISLYQRNIESICRTHQEIRQQVQKTVMHEIGHHFGMNERELRDAGY